MISGLLQPALLLADPKTYASQIYLWLGVIVALAFVLGFIALWLRKKLLTDHEQPPMGFTLKDLRAMHEAGDLSDEELAAAEEKALARSRSHYLGHAVAPIEEPEDIGHLSTGSEDDFEAGTENVDGVSDKNPGDEPRP
ncbi:MAG: hypothetical protein KTR15_05205 [Phycisphaeraceae bacterium]|nr:hypothetical protein [Phycisphaeraceae bacterium]